MKCLLSALLLFALLALPAFAVDNEPVNTLPNATNSSFNAQARAFWQSELPAILGRYFPSDWVYSGGLHATSASCTSAAFAVEAFTRADATAHQNRVTADSAGGSVAINYAAVSLGANCANPGSDVCWVAVSGANVPTLPSSNFKRSGTSNYYVLCGTSSQPTTPAGAALLMSVTITNGTISAVQDVRQRGPMLNLVDACRYASLNAAVTAQGNAPAAFVVGCLWPVTADVTVPSTMGLTFVGQGQLTAASAFTVTVQGAWAGERRRIIGSNVTVSFTGALGPDEVYPEWWGALADGVPADNCIPINKALTAAPANGRVSLGHGSYTCNSTTVITIPQTVTLHGTHRRYSRIVFSGTTTSGVINVGVNVNWVTIRDLGVQLASTGTAAYGMHLQGARIVVRDVFIEPEVSTNPYGTACIRTSDTPVSNEHLYRDLDLPYCIIGIQALDGTTMTIENVTFSSYNVGIKSGVSTVNGVVDLHIIGNTFTTTASSPYANSVAIDVQHGFQTTVMGNNFDLDVATPGVNFAQALSVNRYDTTGGHTYFVGNRLSGNGSVSDVIVPNGNLASGITITGNTFARLRSPSYVVKRFSVGGEIVDYGPNTYVTAFPVSPQFPVLDFATPDVGNGNVFKAADTVPTTWTGFGHATPGKRFTVEFTTGNTTVGFGAGGTTLIGGVPGKPGANWTPVSGDAMSCQYDGVNTLYFYCTPIIITPTSFLFANRAAHLPSNGMFGYCSDCTIANPCAGGGNGAFAKKLNGDYVCN